VAAINRGAIHRRQVIEIHQPSMCDFNGYPDFAAASPLSCMIIAVVVGAMQ